MRKFFVLIILLFNTTVALSQCMDINWINPLPQGNHIVGLQVVSDDTVYCVGEGGTFLRTYDGGQTWFNNRIKYFDLYHINFVTGNVGFACGFGASYGRVYKTQDAGQTWFEVFVTPGPQQALYQVCFIDANTGFTAGWPGGTIYKTTDGGATWSGKASGGTGYIYSLQFITSNRGIAMIANSQVSITNDGGDTWTKQNLPGNPTITAMHFADSLNGFITTSANTDAYKTNDGGNTWTTIAHALPWFRRDVYFTSKDTGYVASSSFDVQVSKTVDGGATWTSQIVATVYNGVQLAFSPGNKDIGYLAASAGKFMKTTDGGATWNSISSGFYNYLYDMQFVGDSTIYVCSSTGFINKSTDLGATWTTLTTGTSKQIKAMHFINDSTGIAIGDLGTVIKTTNSGNTWSSKNGQNSLYQYDIQFINNQLGLLCGAAGLIRRSTNGGDTWNIVSSGVNHLLTKIFMVNADTMYVAADSGRVLRSIDGGQTWVQTFTNNNARITGLHFFNGMYGLCGNDGEYIYRTYDAGQTWTEIYDGWGAPVEQFAFMDEQVGYYLQSDLSNANLLRTADGGDTWTYTDFNIGDELTTLTLHKGELYACGYFGKIVKITPQVLSPVVQPFVACGQGTYTLTVTSTMPVYWFNFPYTNNPVDSGLSFITPFLTTDDTFFVASYDAATQCYSPIMPVVVHLQSLPLVTCGINDTVCNYASPFTLFGGLPQGGVYAGPGVNNNVFDPAQAQFGINSINYTYTDINGCNASAAGTIFVSSCTAIDENTSSGFLIYPAITHDFVFIKSTALHQTNMIVKVLSAEGKICYTAFLNQSSEIDLRSCAPGMYTVVIETANKVFKQRVAKIE